MKKGDITSFNKNWKNRRNLLQPLDKELPNKPNSIRFL